jgi:hypothetical protein
VQGKPCWKQTGSPLAPNGFKYKDLDLTPDGASTITLRSGGSVPGTGAGTCSRRDGWKANRARTSFTYRNASGFLDPGCQVPSRRLSKMVVKDKRARSGEIQVQVQGKEGTYPIALPLARIEAQIALAWPRLQQLDAYALRSRPQRSILAGDGQLPSHCQLEVSGVVDAQPVSRGEIGQPPEGQRGHLVVQDHREPSEGGQRGDALLFGELSPLREHEQGTRDLERPQRGRPHDRSVRDATEERL